MIMVTRRAERGRERMTILSRQSYWGRVTSPAELLVRDQTQYGKQEIDDGSLDVWEEGRFIGKLYRNNTSDKRCQNDRRDHPKQ